jgi:hypothetical protein
MDARYLAWAFVALISTCQPLFGQVLMGSRSVVETPNFRIYARSASLANQIARAAEENRKQLANHWLGRDIPNWPRKCPVTVHDGNIAANGETKYVILPGGGVADFQMTVSGTPERILDSVLPHEITHTIMASHFAAMGKPIPRWADEGVCTTVEHISERSKHDQMLVRYIGEGRGIPFAVLFALRDYPRDMMPLYAQGYSLSCFLIAQGGPRKFVKFLERGMEEDNWVSAVNEYYQYPMMGKLQLAWTDWVEGGGGAVEAFTAEARGVSTIAASNPRVPQRDDKLRLASTESNKSMNPDNSMNPSESGSYYLEQLRLVQGSAVQANANASRTLGQNGFVPAPKPTESHPSTAIPYSASQPAPFQSLHGNLIR